MSKYEPLARFLAEVEEDSIRLKFSEIAKLIPDGLPQSAYDYRPWWAIRYDGKGAQNQAWQSVGWETSDVDVKREAVTFNRAVKRRADFKDSPYTRSLTIAEAKAGLAAQFRVTEDCIEIVVRA